MVRHAPERRTLVVTDSSACLPARVAARPYVRVLPIAILLEDGEFPDGPETAPRVYAALAAGEPVRSSPPTAVEYVKAVEEGDFDAAVVVTPAEEFTVMYRNASVAGRLAARPVEIVDCRTAAAAQSLVVLAVVDAVEEGATAAEAAAVAREVAGRAHLLAALPTMHAVEQNASLPGPVAGKVGAVMPSLFRFHAGTVTHVGDVRPGVDPVDALRQACGGCGGPALVFHADEERLARRLAAALPGRPRVVPFSPAMAVHTGAGWIGVAWLT
ncbi:MAG TPA: DegV family protein [Acidimicrobiales bacterium]|nr:DegV family protein [Acidimicrobiales bacterium]